MSLLAYNIIIAPFQGNLTIDTLYQSLNRPFGIYNLQYQQLELNSPVPCPQQSIYSAAT
jgi:hypothetical protein